MKRAKGSVLIDFVKTIKANKTGVYDKYLTDEDRSIINQRILPNQWYPFDTFKRIVNAIVEVAANKNLEMVRQWGRLYGQAIMGDVYKHLLKQGEPMEYIKKYPVYVRNFYDFGTFEVIEENPTQALVKMKDFDADFVPLFYIIWGWLEKTLELCGAKNLKTELVSQSWAGAKETAIRFKWTM